VSYDTPETVESIETVITDSDTVSVNLAATDPTPATTAIADSDTVSVNLAPTEPPTTAAPPASVSAPVGVPLAASPPPPTPPLPPVVVDSDSESEMAEVQSNTQFAPQKFKGLINENAKDWIRQFDNYCQYKEFNADKKMALFKVLLVDSAAVWYDSLQDANTDTWAHVKTL